MTAIDVSVVIPTRDRWPIVARAVRSAAQQRDVRVEVVVVDDGSREPVGDRLRAIGHGGIDLRVERHTRPRGVGSARNTGTALARGDWLAFLDDDDLWAPDKLSRQIGAAAAAGASWVYCSALAVTPAGRYIRAFPAPEPTGLLRGLLQSNVMPAGASNIVVRPGLLADCGGFDEDLSQLDDWDLCLKLARRATPAAMPEALVAYLVHPGNRSVADPADLLDEIQVFRKRYAELAMSLGTRFDEADAVRWVASAHRRGGRRRRAAALYGHLFWSDRSPRDLARIVVSLTLPRRVPSGRGCTPTWVVDQLREPTLT